MTKPLVVVESPTKVRTIKKYLGDDYNISATVGHIKDLPDREIGIDIDDGFKPMYRNIPGKQKVITALKRAAGDATDVYLAPDPDREGEAIAWHTAEVLHRKGRQFHRVLFHELTPRAIKAAMAAPESLHKAKYEAQQARRILDRLVGYQISPLLWRKVKRGLSAGRVQSVAVRIICEREREIQVFDPREYWSITAHLEGESPPPFIARLTRKIGEKDKINIPDGAAAEAILSALEGRAPVVDKVVKKTTRRNPPPPFTTSKLQQEAIRRLRFSAKKTMMVAQQLYEGIDLGPGEPVGLITYMRTDSTRISADAAQEALALIRERFGADYAMEQPRFFKNKNKVQDAHEAIRPAAVIHTPDSVAAHLDADQLALYTLIWQRFMASQMTPALINNHAITIRAGDYQFQATGATIAFPGFMTLYRSEEDGEDGESTLPELAEGSVLQCHRYEPKQHYTQPPPRFSEATLVKELEENGIGRPSTYAAILSTIREKGYVEMFKGSFRPTELGFIVNDLIVDSFPDIMDVEFTARMENDLDRVEAAEEDYLTVLRRFYDSFKQELDAADERMRSMKREGVPTGLECPQCARPLHIKMGKNGLFLACSGYPECNFTRDYTRTEKGEIQPVDAPREEATDKACEKCARPMVVRRGRYGTFLACSGYPECTHTESIQTDNGGQRTGVACPRRDCKGELLERRSKRGKVFYGCSRFPECDFATWDRPVERACPDCGSPYLLEKANKKRGTFLACPNRDCQYTAEP